MVGERSPLPEALDLDREILAEYKELKGDAFSWKDFNERLRHAQEAIREQDRKVAGKGTAYSLGFRIATDLVVAVIAGLGIGWGLDKLLGTEPVFLLIFMPLGIAAGILNVIRVAKSDEARRHMEQMSSTKAPSVKDDDDD